MRPDNIVSHMLGFGKGWNYVKMLSAHVMLSGIDKNRENS